MLVGPEICCYAGRTGVRWRLDGQNRGKGVGRQMREVVAGSTTAPDDKSCNYHP